MPFASLPTWVGAVFPNVANKDTLLKLCKVYDDSGDGTIDFAELMVMCKDMARIGKGEMPPVFVVASGLIGVRVRACPCVFADVRRSRCRRARWSAPSSQRCCAPRW